jgi:hypothetical protein
VLFNVEYDHGDVLEGYLIPDGFSDEPKIIVARDDGTLVSFSCDQPRPAVVQSGRHATGMVGFRLDRKTMPDLVLQDHLAIHEAKSGLLIYRRPLIDSPVQMKLLRLELSLLPMNKFDQYCGHHFQYAVSAVERYGHETTLQAFHLNGVPSIFISGRLLLRNYEEFLDKGFRVIADIPDPYYEMASRLFILKRLAKGSVTFIGDRDRLILSAAVEHFADVNLTDTAGLNRALKRAPDKVRTVLLSPVTRQLVTSYPEQRVSRRDVAPAIDALSRFTVVGYGDENTHFQDAVGELLGLEGPSIPVLPRHSILKELARQLSELPVAELMLEEDLIFDHYVRHALMPYIS